MKRLLLAMGFAMGGAGCATIDSTMLESFDTATSTAQSYIANTNVPATREYRLAAYQNAAASSAGVFLPSNEPTAERVLTLARTSLCDAQTVYYIGVDSTRTAAAAGRTVRSFDVTPPDTIVGNLALIAAPAPPPRSAAQPEAPSAPHGVPGLPEPGGVPGLPEQPEDDASAEQTANPVEMCASDFDFASRASLRGGTTESGAGAAFLDLITGLESKLKPQALALLQVVARAQQHQRLMTYIRENDAEFAALAENLRALDGPLRTRAETTRRLRAYEYILAYDAMRSTLRDRSLGSPDPLSIAPHGAIDLRTHAETQDTLDAAAAYDAALSDAAPQAFQDLAKAIDDLRNLPNQNSGAATASSIRTTLNILTALRTFAEATNDAELRRLVDEAHRAL